MEMLKDRIDPPHDERLTNFTLDLDRRSLMSRGLPTFEKTGVIGSYRLHYLRHGTRDYFLKQLGKLDCCRRAKLKHLSVKLVVFARTEKNSIIILHIGIRLL